MRSIHNSTRAFTIIEIMVTVGILVLIAAGVSTIFTSVADTVNTGRKVAQLNRYAAQLERVMRTDFENMTRDGFMVVVNQYAPGDDPLNSFNDRDVQLSPADGSDQNDNGDPGRPRRIDEIMFFARSDYETTRRTISPGMIARASEASIYYGHGQKRRPDLERSTDPMLGSQQANLFFNPFVNDNNIRFNIASGINQAGLGTASTDGGFNPNQYASDWALLRHVTLLVKPQTSGQDLPDDLFGYTRVGDERVLLEDSPRQVSLQPAARSIFNSLAQTGFNNLPDTTGGFITPKWFGDRQIQIGGPAAIPSYTDPILRASGIVDIVTDDLSRIRTMIYGLAGSTDVGYDDPTDYWARNNTNRIQTPMDLSYDEFASVFWEDTLLSPRPRDAMNVALPLTGVSSPQFTNVRAWMIDALPSIWEFSTIEEPTQLSRVRYEDVPTRLLYDADAFGNPNDDNAKRLRTYAEANQEMLGSSVFVPRCTEFIVEWSFGFIDPSITMPDDPRYKQMRWHGLERWIDSNNDGQIDTSGSGVDAGEDQIVATHYEKRTTVNSDPATELILGRISGATPDTEIATFGYPDMFNNDWPWPKYIRITMSIADPLDQNIEETFQMVFELPDASVN
jgi:type II secretory pathway pseudopilin PulG